VRRRALRIKRALREAGEASENILTELGACVFGFDAIGDERDGGDVEGNEEGR
jgi:hypothetical protein